MNPWVTRQHTPGPWHDNIADMYVRFANIAPLAAAVYIARKTGLTLMEVKMVVEWTRLRKHTAPCPVA